MQVDITNARTAEFRTNYFAIERAILDPASLDFFHRHALKRSKGKRIALGDVQVANAPVAYGDPHCEKLLEMLRPRVERVCRLKLWPTYSYLRVYRRGNVLNAHRDRPSCEISMTVNLGAKAKTPWPIWIAGPRGLAAVALNPGDGLIYRGCDCYHWREPFEGIHQAQVFLHYVDRNGPNREWKFDKRPRLSTLGNETRSSPPS